MLARLAIACACIACAPEDERPASSSAVTADAYRTTPGLFESGAAERPALRSLPARAEIGAAWTRSHGDLASTKYSAADALRPDNVAGLEVAWRHDEHEATGGGWQTNVEANPIVVGRTLVAATPQDTVVALDAATGALRWRFAPDPPARPARRGMMYWAGDSETDARLFMPVGDELIALRFADGRLDPGFGEGGRISLPASTTAPAVARGRLVATGNEPAAVYAFDVVSGAPLWQTRLVPGASDDDDAGAAPWGGFSLDARRGLVFVTTGNPRPALTRADHAGAHPYANSVVALSVENGRIVWSFQEIEHDLWNLDIAAPPVLATVMFDGEPVDVVAAVTKAGNLLLLERDTGQPIFDFRRRRAPRGDVPGETYATHQPDLVRPEPFARVAFGAADVTDIDEASRADVQSRVSRAVGGFFEPPRMFVDLVTFGLHGGAAWPGAALDPHAAKLYVPVNRAPWRIRRNLYTRDEALPPGRASDHYRQACASCHRASRNGKGRLVGDIVEGFVPSLVGAAITPRAADFFDAKFLAQRHPDVEASAFDQAKLDVMREAFETHDRALLESRSFWAGFSAATLRDRDGYPASKPPWGELVRIDLASGRIDWRVPVGEYEALRARGVPATGQPSYGGVVATAGGLVFATGTPDAKLRAFDAASGGECWQARLPAAGSAPPISYSVDGRQYVAVVATGGRFHGFDARASQIVAFALPDD